MRNTQKSVLLSWSSDVYAVWIFCCCCRPFLNTFFDILIKTPEIYKEFLISIANIFNRIFLMDEKKWEGRTRYDKKLEFFSLFRKNKINFFFSQHPIKAYEHLLQCDIMYSLAIFIIWLIRQWLENKFCFF